MGIKDIFSSKTTYTAPNKPLASFLPAQKAKADVMPAIPVDPNEAIYNQASQSAQQKYGVSVPPNFLKAIRQQESSGIVDPNDFGRSFGLVNQAGANGAKMALGKNYLPDTSLANSAQNAAHYLASRAYLKDETGATKVDLSTPENQSKWYVQRYVGILPGQSRVIGGQKVSYDQIKKSFEQKLKENQPQ